MMLLGDEQLRKVGGCFLDSQRGHLLTEAAMDIAYLSSLPHLKLTLVARLRLPARPPLTHPVDESNVTLKKTIFEKAAPKPPGG